MATVGLPLTGTGDVTAKVATDLIGDENYQRMKLHDGADGSTLAIRALGTTPVGTDGGMVVRPIASTAFNQAVVGAIGLTSGSSVVGISSGSSAVELTSAGSTRLAGRFTLENPTTSLDASATLTSAGSTRLVGQVTVANPTTSVSLSTQLTVTVGNPTTAIDLSSGGSTKVIGTVNTTGTTKVDVSSGVILAGGSSANTLGAVALVAGTTANALGSVALVAGTSANTLGSVALVAGSSANTIGNVAQGPGSSANVWYTQPLAFSSGNVARTSVGTSVDVSVIAANANRKALVIANLSTVQIVALGMSTAAVTTGLANVSIYLPPNSQLTFGYSGGLPLFLGPFRGINISSTALGGGVAVMEFT